MDSSTNNKSSCLLLFLLLITFSGFMAVIQVGAVEADPEELRSIHWGSWDILFERSFGYGVEIPGRVITNFVPVNHIPPMNATRVLTTCQDGQTSVSVKVYQGDSSSVERECARYFKGECDDIMKNASADLDDKDICEFWDVYCQDLELSHAYFGDLQLHALPPAPRGVPQIEVSFGFKDDKLHVKVMDKATMKVNSTSFTYGVARSLHRRYCGLSSSEIAYWKAKKVDPFVPKATRNHIDSDAVCLFELTESR